MKREVTLVIGGCRSGKSGEALRRAEATQARAYLYLATCVPHDVEMVDRVARHQQERDARWQTLEVPLELPRAIQENGCEDQVLLVDCLTLWLNNLVLTFAADGPVLDRIAELAQVLGATRGQVILVTNEVGAGIVPENRLARRFRDLAGLTHQRVAAVADQVCWMVAGIPVRVKG